MVTRLLRLRTAPHPTDAADGVAAALTYCLTSRAPRLPGRPAPRSVARA
jgi:crossover junction endodeoxyribonuclease RuvC